MRIKYLFQKVAKIDDPFHAHLAEALVRFFVTRKQARRAHSTTLVENFTESAHVDISKRLHTYEQGYLSSGYSTIDQIKKELEKSLLSSVGEFNKFETGTMSERIQKNLALENKIKKELKYTENKEKDLLTIQMGETEIGRILFQGQRFSKLDPQPANIKNEVWTKQGDLACHYIRYKIGENPRFVRRYAIRGLNQSDARNLFNNKGLVAAERSESSTTYEVKAITEKGINLPIDDEYRKDGKLSDKSMILSHTRGWSKRFISTTVTRRPVFSTRGTEFRSLFGQVIIDLAKIDASQIFDIHTPDSLFYFSVSAQNLIQTGKSRASPNQTLSGERLLAALDAIRTREVLIKSTIPKEAVLKKKTKEMILGIYDSNSQNAKKAQQTAEEVFAESTIIFNEKNTEEPPYREPKGWFKYYKFSSEAELTKACKLLSEKKPEFKFQYQKVSCYDFPDSLPTGFPPEKK